MTQTMTPKQQYEAALARADKLGVKIVGRGRWVSGAAFFLVSSATTDRPHIVTVGNDGTQACDCPARQLCMHRAVVRKQLAADALATSEHLERIRRAMDEERAATALHLQAASAKLDEMEQREAARKRDTAMLASRASNRGFSIWAAND